MELYFAPLACSLATRISLYEVGAPAQRTRFTQVDTRAKRLADGGDFLAVNPMGQVPVLRTDDGELLTENTAVLQYVAERFPEAKLAPERRCSRARGCASGSASSAPSCTRRCSCRCSTRRRPRP